MSTAAVITARGTVRGASTISSPIVDALSTPPNANAIVDRNTRSFRLAPGASVAGVNDVADPYRAHEYRPNPHSSTSGIHPLTAPTLLSHLPMSSPMTFSVTAIVRPVTAKIVT